MSTWVLLRGLTREARHWGAFPEVLRHAIPDAEILALDLPGNGTLHHRQSPATVEAMAECCRTELARRGVRPPYRLLAMSLGAMVAVAWARAHGKDIAGCVLINTSLRPVSPFHHRLRPGSYPALLRFLLPGVSDEDRESTILRLTSRRPEAHAEVLSDWIAWRRQHRVSRANALRQLVAAARFRAPASKPAVPLLVLAGARDALVDVRCSQALAQRWQIPLDIHPDAGHDLPLDDPAWVAGRVRSWLQDA